MPVVKRIRNRGATITVESHAEILFMPGGQVHNWTNRFTGRIRAATIAAAPTNKRPRWAHYGKPLKTTIVSARPRFWANGHDRMRVYAAVGSTAPHAYYVDQGTGVYAGRGAYEAAVLPPWQHGSPSLYEATWRPGGPGGRKVSPVMIRGQRGQFFFDEGLKRAFQSMRMRSFQIPGEIKMTDGLGSVATGLEGFFGNTPSDAAFRAQLEEWRSWRDEAWDAHRGLGRGGGIGSRMHAEYVARAKAEAINKAAVKGTATKNAPKSTTKVSAHDAYVASVAAAERRRKAQIAELRKRQEAKALGEKRRLEKERREAEERAKRRLAREFEKARIDAYKYLHAIEAQYPDAQVQISKDRSMIRVHFTGPGGVPHNEYFLR